MTGCPWTFRGILTIDQYHVSFMVRVGIVRGCITSSLTTCSGQGVVIQGKGNEKEWYSRILGINPHKGPNAQLAYE